MASLHLLEKSLLPEPVACQSHCLAPPPALPTFPSSWGGGSRSLGTIWFFFPQLLPSPLPSLLPLAEVWPLGLVLPGIAGGERAWRTGMGGD